MKILIKQLVLSACLVFGSAWVNAQNLYSSLVEVNNRWLYESDFPQSVFELMEEENPIQTHLLLVQQSLSKRSTNHLNDLQKKNRLQALAKLKEYALKAEFPNNISHQSRIPVFIGSNGNYCAVGHLIKESGFDPLAKKISAKMNFQYLLDMEDQALNSWIANSGFTANELAWIQPGYPPVSIAEKMDSGFNGPVNVIFSNSLNEIIAGGVFDSSGNQSIKGISIWKNGIAGYDWLKMGLGGLEYSVEDMVEFNGGLVVAGNIYYADTVYVSSGVAFWDGSKWSGMGSFYIGALQNIVYDVEVYNGELYAGGIFRNDFGSSIQFSNIAKWDGNDWQNLPASPQGIVYALEVHNNELILGGTFNSIDTVQFNHIAAFDGSQFKQLGNGVEARIYALESVGDTLFAGGEFLSGSLLDTFGLGYFHNGNWTKINSEHLQINAWDSKVECIEASPYGVFVGGDLDYFPLVGTYAKNLLLVKNGDLEPFATLDSTVKSLKYQDGYLYAGGMFTKSMIGFGQSDSLNHIVYFDLQKQFSLEDEKSSFKASIFPNPAVSQFTLNMEEYRKVLNFQLYDLLGKKLDFEMEAISDKEYKFSVNGLSKGLYILKIQTEMGVLDKKVILGE